MRMKLAGLDTQMFYKGLYTAWHNVLCTLEKLQRHTNIKSQA